MLWPGYTSFVVGAMLRIFVSLFLLLICILSEGCLIYISCLFLAFYNLFVFHVISTQLDRYINVYRNCKYVVHFSNQMYLLKKKKKSKMAVIILIVFIHQLLCIENTKEQLTDMNFCHPLQEIISSLWGATATQDPLLRGSFFLATPLNYKTNISKKIGKLIPIQG